MNSASAQEGYQGAPAERQAPPAGQYQQQQRQQPGTNVSTEKLKKFKSAQQDVIQSQRQLQQKMNTAESPEQRAQIQQQANEEMVDAIADAGLSVNEYNQIATAVQENPGLRDKYMNLR